MADRFSNSKNSQEKALANNIQQKIAEVMDNDKINMEIFEKRKNRISNFQKLLI